MTKNNDPEDQAISKREHYSFSFTQNTDGEARFPSPLTKTKMAFCPLTVGT